MQEAESQTTSMAGEIKVEDEGEELEASHVYLLLKKDLPISRNLRAEWYLEHLNTVIRVPRWNDISELTKELEVVSIEPFDPPADFDNDTAHEYRYRVTRRTALHCLGHRYRLVYGIDLSPSMCRVIRGQGGEAQVLLQKVHSALADAINGVLQQFYVPGSELLFYPVVYVTILAHTSVFRCDWQLVLVQGWYLMQGNLDPFLDYLSERLKNLYVHLAENTTKLNEERLLQPPPSVSPYVHPSLSHPFNDQSSLDGDSSFDPDQDVSFEQACFDPTNCGNNNNNNNINNNSSGGGRSRFEAVNSSYSSSPVSSHTGLLTRQSSPVRKILKQPECNHKSCGNVQRYAKYLESLAKGTTTTTSDNSPGRHDGIAPKKGGRLKKTTGAGGGDRVGWRSEGSSIAEEVTTKGLLESALTPDMSFVNLLRYCVVALQLLPKTSISGIIVLTDGVFCMPDASLFDALLNQVRNMTISISFLHLTEKPKEILEPPQSISPSLSPPNSPSYQQVPSSFHHSDPSNPLPSTTQSLGVGSISSFRPPGSLPPLVRDALRNLFSFPDLHEFDSESCDGELGNAAVGQEVLQLREELIWRQARVQQRRSSEGRYERSRYQGLREPRSWLSERTTELDRGKENPTQIACRGWEEEKPSSSCLVRRVSWQDEVVLLKPHAECQSGNFKEKWEESLNLQSGYETNKEMLAGESSAAEAFEAEMFSEEEDWDDDWIDEDEESFGEDEMEWSTDRELEEQEQLKRLTLSACSLRRERHIQNKSRDASQLLSRILAGSDVENNHRHREKLEGKPNVNNVSEGLFALRPLGTVSRYTNVSLSSSGLSSAYRPRFTSQLIMKVALRAAAESSVTHQPVNTTAAAAAAEVVPETRRRLSTEASVVPPYAESSIRPGSSFPEDGGCPFSLNQCWADLGNQHYGLVSYTHLLQFLASSTGGVYMDTTLHIPKEYPYYIYEMNPYHRAFLTWSFQQSTSEDHWGILRPDLSKNTHLNLLHCRPSGRSRKRMELSCSVRTVLSCRLREGFSVRAVEEHSGAALHLVLPWKHGILLHYTVRSRGKLPLSLAATSQLSVELSVEAPYEFLVDIERNEQLRCSTPYHNQQYQELLASEYRYELVSKYQATLRELKETDSLLVRLQNFALNPQHYTVPDFMRKGHPAFYYKPSLGLVPFSESGASPVLCDFWRPVCLLDVGSWHKWFHTHRIGLVLEHDAPLPRTLHNITNNNRFGLVQCRLAELTLANELSQWCDFMLVEGQTYVKFLYKEDYEVRTPESNDEAANVAFRSTSASASRMTAGDSYAAGATHQSLDDSTSKGVLGEQIHKDSDAARRRHRSFDLTKNEPQHKLGQLFFDQTRSGKVAHLAGLFHDDQAGKNSHSAPVLGPVDKIPAFVRGDTIGGGVPPFRRSSSALDSGFETSGRGGSRYNDVYQTSAGKEESVNAGEGVGSGAGKIKRRSDAPPVSFLIVRMSPPRPPCMAVRIAFLGGTPGSVRQRLADELTCRLVRLQLPLRSRHLKKHPLQQRVAAASATSRHNTRAARDAATAAALASKVGVDEASMGEEQSPVPLPCCVITQKQIEKILIWYDSLPTNMLEVVSPESTVHLGYQASHPFNFRQMPLNNQALLSRYLHHRRWIWDIVKEEEKGDQSAAGGQRGAAGKKLQQAPPALVLTGALSPCEEPKVPPPDMKTLSRILHSLTRIRLNEGFKIAFSHNGIITMVREFMMKLLLEAKDSNSGVRAERFPCVVQYVLFPPHYQTPLTSALDDEGAEVPEKAGGSGSPTTLLQGFPSPLELVTECWVEPQNGVVVPLSPSPPGMSVAHTPLCHTPHLTNLAYYQLPSAIHEEDRKVVSSLLTFNYLSEVAHLPASQRKSSCNSRSSVLALIASLLQAPQTEPEAPPPITTSATSTTFNRSLFSSSLSATNLTSKVHGSGVLTSSIIRTNSTTLPASQTPRGESGEIRDFRLRAGTLAGRLSGLSNRRLMGYSSLDDPLNAPCNGSGRAVSGGTSSVGGGGVGGGGHHIGLSSGTIIGEVGYTTSPGVGVSSSGPVQEHRFGLDPSSRAGVHNTTASTVLSNSSGSATNQFSSCSRSSSVGSNRLFGPAAQEPTKGWEWPGTEGDQERVQRVAFIPELTSLLPYCTQAEILLSTFTQDLYYRLVKNVSLPTEHRNDALNHLLYSLLLDQLLDLHNGHEVPLSDADHAALPGLLRGRPCLQGGHFAQYFAEPGDEVPKWRCLVKAASSTNLLVTVLPASYHDLKLLLLHRSNIVPNNTNPAVRLISSYDNLLRLEKASGESSERSDAPYMPIGSTESTSSSMLITGSYMSHRSSTLSSSGHHGSGGHHQCSAMSCHGSSGSGHGNVCASDVSGSAGGGHLLSSFHSLPLQHQRSLPNSPRPSSTAMVFPKSTSVMADCCNFSAQQLQHHPPPPMRTRFKSGPSPLHVSQKQQNTTSHCQEGFNRTRASSFHGRRERSGSLSKWMKSSERCRTGSVDSSAKAVGSCVTCTTRHHLASSHQPALAQNLCNFKQQQLPCSKPFQLQSKHLPYHLQLARQQSTPSSSDKSRKRYLSMPVKSLPVSGLSNSPSEFPERCVSASVSTEALQYRTVGPATYCPDRSTGHSASDPLSGEQTQGHQRRQSCHTPFLGALTLPVYMYDCRLDSIISQLVHRSKSRNIQPDIFRDFSLNTDSKSRIGMKRNTDTTKKSKGSASYEDSYYSEKHFMPASDEGGEGTASGPCKVSPAARKLKYPDVEAEGSAARGRTGDFRVDSPWFGGADLDETGATMEMVEGPTIARPCLESRPSSGRTMTEHEASKRPPEGDPSDDFEASGTARAMLWQVEACQYRSLVVAGYEALVAGLSVHAVDLQPVLDQCHETVHEIDITEYLHAICGHLHDFSVRLKVEENQALPKKDECSDALQIGKGDPVENWEKQGTLEQMESVEQLGQLEKDSVRRANTRDDKLFAATAAAHVSLSDEHVLDLHTATAHVVIPSDLPPLVMTSTDVHHIDSATSKLVLKHEPVSRANDTLPLSTPPAALSTSSDFNVLACHSAGGSNSAGSSSHPRGVLERQHSLHEDTRPLSPTLLSDKDTTPTPEDPGNASASSQGNKDYKERQESGSSQSHSSLFPVWLLEQHQPCRNLVSLHSSIRQRCSTVLGQHYRPVPALPDHHYFVASDGLTASSQVAPTTSCGGSKARGQAVRQSLMKQRSWSGGAADDDAGSWAANEDGQDSLAGEEDGHDDDEGFDHSIEFRSEIGSLMMRRLHSQISTQEFDEDKSSTLSDGQSSPPPHSGCSPLPSAGGRKTAQEHSSAHNQRAHCARSFSYSGAGSGISGPAPVPLFLHLTCTLRCPGIEPVTTPMTSLPTCLRDVIPNLAEQELDLRQLRLSLDVLSLTLPTSLASPLFQNVLPTNANNSHVHTAPPPFRRRRNSSSAYYRFSTCSSSSPPPFFGYRPDGGLLSDLDESVEKDPMDLLPEEQRQAIDDTTQQLSWLVLDEVCAMGLNELPLTEATVTRVVKHVRRSQHCPNATLDTVPLEFVTGGNTSRDSFVKEFDQLHIYLSCSYRLHRLGRYHVLVLGNQRCRRYPASVVPPLAPASHHVKMVPHSDDATELQRLAALQQQEPNLDACSLQSPSSPDTIALLRRDPPNSVGGLLASAAASPPPADRGSLPPPQHQPLARVKSPVMDRPAAAVPGEQADGQWTPKSSSPTKLFRKVSFETQEGGEDRPPSSCDAGAAAEKEKWAKRRERKERRDSERRGSISSTDSEHDADVLSRHSYSRESSQPRDKTKDKERSKLSRERTPAATRASKTPERSATDTGKLCPADRDSEMDKSSSRTAAEQSCADSDMTVLEMIRRVTNASDVSELVDESSLDVVDGSTLSRQQLRRTDPVAELMTLPWKEEKIHCGQRSSLMSAVCRQDALIAAPSVEGFEPATALQVFPVVPDQRTSQDYRDSVAQTGGSIVSSQVASLDTRVAVGLQPQESDAVPAHPPLQRTGSVNVSVRCDAVLSETLRKSASTDDCCTPAARTLAASDVRCSADSARARHNSSVAHDVIRLKHNAGIEGAWGSSCGSSSKSRHNSGGGLPLPSHNTCCGASSGYSSYPCCGVGHAGGGHVSDVSSLLESGQTTDIGCEGDVSESDDCADWLQEFETAQPCLPKFWLIMHVGEKVVSMYFHCRLPCDVNAYHCVMAETKLHVQSLVHHVNQSLLLHRLHKRRMCHSLLTPPSPDTAWDDDCDCLTDNYLEASLKHEPGFFSCPLVWSICFELHPKLKGGYGSKSGSQGLQALRSTLNMFSVNNRTNMFVYQDTSGPSNTDNIFYLRLTEVSGAISGQRGSQQFHPSGSLTASSSAATLINLRNSIIGTHTITTNTIDDVTSSSTPAGGGGTTIEAVPGDGSRGSLKHRTASKDEDPPSLVAAEHRPRISSFGERDVVGGPAAARSTNLIELTVHGISQPGPSIQEELVLMLQKRLDDSVLDAIYLMLCTNPHAKLPPEDVHFIQPPNQTPRLSLRLTLGECSNWQLPALLHYLHQNMLASGFTKPKYTDSRPKFSDSSSHYNHFQDYTQGESLSSNGGEENIFLYVCKHKSGAKGIACIALSVVDQLTNSAVGVNTAVAPPPTADTSDVDLLLFSHRFEQLTQVTVGEGWNDVATVGSQESEQTAAATPHPLPATSSTAPVSGGDCAVVFHVWSIGRVPHDDMAALLRQVCRPALWDLHTEYVLLPHTLCPAATTRDRTGAAHSLDPSSTIGGGSSAGLLMVSSAAGSSDASQLAERTRQPSTLKQSEASPRLGPARHSIDVTTPTAGLLTVPGGGPSTSAFAAESNLRDFTIDPGDTDEEEGEYEGSGDEDRKSDEEVAQQEMDGLVEQEVHEQLRLRELDRRYGYVAVPWLRYAADLAAPTVNSFAHTLPTSESVAVVLEELQRWLSQHMDDSPLSCYQRTPLLALRTEARTVVTQRRAHSRLAKIARKSARRRRRGRAGSGSRDKEAGAPKLDRTPVRVAATGGEKILPEYLGGDDGRRKKARNDAVKKNKLANDGNCQLKKRWCYDAEEFEDEFDEFLEETTEETACDDSSLSRDPDHVYLIVDKYKPSGIDFLTESPSSSPYHPDCLLFARSPPILGLPSHTGTAALADGRQTGQGFPSRVVPVQRPHSTSTQHEASVDKPSAAVSPQPSPASNLMPVTVVTSSNVPSTGSYPSTSPTRPSSSFTSSHGTQLKQLQYHNGLSYASTTDELGATFGINSPRADFVSVPHHVSSGGGTQANNCRHESGGSGSSVGTAIDLSEEGSIVVLPRQSLLTAAIEGNAISIITYNWSKESLDRLQCHLSRVLHWSLARHALLSSIALQKLGLVDDQPFCRRPHSRGRASALGRRDAGCPGDMLLGENPFLDNQALVESLIKLGVPSKEAIASVSQQLQQKMRSTAHQQTPTLKFATQQQQLKFIHKQRFGTQHQPQRRKMARDETASTTYMVTLGTALQWSGCPPPPLPRHQDPLQAHGRQLIKLAANTASRAEARASLMEVLVCAGSSAANTLPVLNARTLALVTQHARLQHFVYTPLLFLPRWRALIGETRDHSVPPTALPPPQPPKQQPVTPQASERSRHDSGTTTFRQSLKELRRGSITSLTSNSPSPLLPARSPHQQPPSFSHQLPATHPQAYSSTSPQLVHNDALNVSGRRRRHLTGGGADDRWHQPLCTSLLQEYIQYLQSYGFKTLPKQATEQTTAAHDFKRSSRSSEDLSSPTFLLMSHRAGAIILKMFFQEPFFAVTLYTLEGSRLRRRPGVFTSQHTMDQFLAEVDNVRVLLHVHSFVHDFHLRTLGAYLADRQLIFHRGYHLSAFLSNFTHYYKKAANYARNMIYTSTESIPSDGVSPEQLYNHLTSKNEQYGMKVMRMTPIVPDESLEMQETEYVLVHVQTCYTRQQPNHPKLADEYEAILLVARDNTKTGGCHWDHPFLQQQQEASSPDGGLVSCTTTEAHDRALAPLHEELSAQRAAATHEDNQDAAMLHIKFYLILTSRRELYPCHVPVNVSDRRSSSSRPRLYEKQGLPAGAAAGVGVGVVPTASTAAAECVDGGAASGGRYRTLSTTVPPAPTSPRPISAAARRRSDGPAPKAGNDKASDDENASVARGGGVYRRPALTTINRTESETLKNSANLHNTRSTPILQDDQSVGAVPELPASSSTGSLPHPPTAIKVESINFLGYFSPYEDSMSNMLKVQARLAVSRIQSIFKLAKIHCRRDTLWTRLTANIFDDEKHKGGSSSINSMMATFEEVQELLKLVQADELQQVDPRLHVFVRQPLIWHQALARLLNSKPRHVVRSATSSDGNRQHVAVMSPDCPNAVILISIDLKKPDSTSLRCVCKDLKSDVSSASDPRTQAFFAAFVNTCCFHLWASKLSSGT